MLILAVNVVVVTLPANGDELTLIQIQINEERIRTEITNNHETKMEIVVDVIDDIDIDVM